MKSVRGHLIAFHLHAAEHHVAAAKCCKAASAHHTELSKHFEVSDPAASGMCKSLATGDETEAGHHTSAGEFHVSCAKDLAESEKAAGNQLEPTRISPNPSQPAPRPNLVPRTGQQVPATDPNAVAKVDGALTHLVRSDDDN